MTMDLKTLLVLFLGIVAVAAVKKSYEGYKVYKVIPNSEEQVKILEDVQKSGVGEFWIDIIVADREAKVMVARENQDGFINIMKTFDVEATEVIADLQKVIDSNLPAADPTNRLASESLFSMTWDRYYSLEQIDNWLDEIQANYPNIVSTVVWGQSVEGRNIKGIIINRRPERENKLIGVIEGTLHSREWIVTATVTWIIKELLTSTDPEVRALSENFEWHILPIANPDGYAYTFTDNRMWRKNRNPIYNTTCSVDISNDMSNGVDLNRNFGFQWMTIGASDDPCTNTFAGSAAFSEPETRAIVNYVQTLHNDGEIIYYLAFHSYSQLIVIPYSHLTSADDVLQASNYANMYEIGVRAAEKLEALYGTHYRVGISAEHMYPMSGTSFDWVKSEFDVPVCYLLELRDLGEYGFLLPPDQIIPNNLEVMEFIKEMDRSTRTLGYYTGSASSLISSAIILIVAFISVMI